MLQAVVCRRKQFKFQLFIISKLKLIMFICEYLETGYWNINHFLVARDIFYHQAVE